MFHQLLSKLKISLQKTKPFVNGRLCEPGSLDATKIQGKIVVCEGAPADDYSTRDKVQEVKSSGGIGLVHITDNQGAVASNTANFPATVISSKDGPTIRKYIKSTR